MYYLANAKLVNGAYVLNFFADTVEDLKNIPTNTKFITTNGTDYGVPLASSIVTVTDKGATKNYILNADGEYVEGGAAEPLLGELEATENKTYKSEDVGLTGWTEVHVDVEPTLVSLNAVENGTYNPAPGEDGYNQVVVNVPVTPTEEKTVELALADGNQVIEPEAGKNLSKVTITKPTDLIPENIKKGVTIAGVVGTYEAVAGE